MTEFSSWVFFFFGSGFLRCGIIIFASGGGDGVLKGVYSSGSGQDFFESVVRRIVSRRKEGENDKIFDLAGNNLATAAELCPFGPSP